MPDVITYPDLDRDARMLVAVDYPAADWDALAAPVKDAFRRMASMVHRAGFRLDEERAA